MRPHLILAASIVSGCLACSDPAPSSTPPEAVTPTAAPTAPATPTVPTAAQTQPAAETAAAEAAENDGVGPVAEAAIAFQEEALAEVAEATGTGDDEVQAILGGIVNSAPTATDEDRAAVPRSAAPGRPDIASSCNTIGFTRECMESSRTGIGHGYRSTERACVNGIFSETDPCPSAGRTGTCRILEGQQVVHYYYEPSERDPDPIARGRATCLTYSGEFHSPDQTTYPLNAVD